MYNIMTKVKLDWYYIDREDVVFYHYCKFYHQCYKKYNGMPKRAERDFVFMVLIVLHGPWSCTHYMLVWPNIWKSDLLPYLFHNENSAWHHPWSWLIALLATRISLLMLSSSFINIVFEIKLLSLISLYTGSQRLLHYTVFSSRLGTRLAYLF